MVSCSHPMELAIAALNALALSWLLFQGLGGHALLTRGLGATLFFDVFRDSTRDRGKGLHYGTGQSLDLELAKRLETKENGTANKAHGTSGGAGNPQDSGEVDRGSFHDSRGHLNHGAARNDRHGCLIPWIGRNGVYRFVEHPKDAQAGQFAAADCAVQPEGPGLRGIVAGWGKEGADVR